MTTSTHYATDRIGAHRAREARTLTTALAIPCALGCASALAPAVEHAVTAGLLGAVLLAGLVIGARLLARRLRERREDYADALTAARWRAVHAPHLLTAADRARVGPHRPTHRTGSAGPRLVEVNA